MYSVHTMSQSVEIKFVWQDRDSFRSQPERYHPGLRGWVPIGRILPDGPWVASTLVGEAGVKELCAYLVTLPYRTPTDAAVV
jgi:hypothetical protein